MVQFATRPLVGDIVLAVWALAWTEHANWHLGAIKTKANPQQLSAKGGAYGSTDKSFHFKHICLFHIAAFFESLLVLIGSDLAYWIKPSFSVPRSPPCISGEPLNAGMRFSHSGRPAYGGAACRSATRWVCLLFSPKEAATSE